GMVEEHAVADAHLVAHEIARRVVAHAAPGGLLAGRSEHVVDRALVGLALHQPVIHFLSEGGASPACAGGLGSRTLAKQGGRFPVTSGSSGTRSAGDDHNSDTRPQPKEAIGSRSMSPIVHSREQDSFRTTFPVLQSLRRGAIRSPRCAASLALCRSPRRAARLAIHAPR